MAGGHNMSRLSAGPENTVHAFFHEKQIATLFISLNEWILDLLFIVSYSYHIMQDCLNSLWTL